MIARWISMNKQTLAGLFALAIMMGVIIWHGGGGDGLKTKAFDPTIGGLRIDVASAGSGETPIKVQDFGNKASFELSIGVRNIVWDPEEPFKPRITYFSDIFGKEPGDGGLKPKIISFKDIFGMDGGGLKPKASFLVIGDSLGEGGNLIDSVGANSKARYQLDIGNKASFLQIIDGAGADGSLKTKISFKSAYPEDVEGTIGSLDEDTGIRPHVGGLRIDL